MVDLNEPAIFAPPDGVAEKYKPFEELTEELNKECAGLTLSIEGVEVLLEPVFPPGRPELTVDGYVDP